MGKYNGKPTEYGWVLKCPYCHKLMEDYWGCDEFMEELERKEVEGEVIRCDHCGRMFKERPGYYVKAKKDYSEVIYPNDIN